MIMQLFRKLSISWAQIAPTSRTALLGLGLTVIGLCGLVPSVFSEEAAVAAPQQTNEIAAPAQITPRPAEPQAIIGHPVRIEVPDVGVDMPVVDGFYDSSAGNWTLYPDKSQFASMTSEPNDKSGQTFIYGHATQRVFGKLLNMQVGQQAFITTANGYKFTYTLKETQVVTPSNTDVLNYTGVPRLLLQTCVGTFSESRKFFILDFTSVQKL